jgi:hypothetical protein
MNPCCAIALFKLPNPTKPTRVLDQIVNITFFHVQSIWLKEVREYLKIRQILNAMMLPHKQKLARKVKPFTMKDGMFYKFGCDNNLKQNLEEVIVIFKEVHERTIR